MGYVGTTSQTSDSTPAAVPPHHPRGNKTDAGEGGSGFEGNAGQSGDNRRCPILPDRALGLLSGGGRTSAESACRLETGVRADMEAGSVRLLSSLSRGLQWMSKARDACSLDAHY